MKRLLRLRLTAAALSAAPILHACHDSPTGGPSNGTASAVLNGAFDPAVAGLSATHNAHLGQLRRLAAHFQRFESAVAAGYTVEVTPCLEQAGVGGQGFHYGNPNFINNAVANLLEPELLLYEPQKNGRMRFVGVEYIIPFTQLPETSAPPTLLGQTFQANTAAGLWALHVWVGRQNPDGLFADWNPNVSCAFAP